jgi:membrane protein YqaA with SNARE-associated domain
VFTPFLGINFFYVKTASLALLKLPLLPIIPPINSYLRLYMTLKLITVAALATFEVYAAIPTGFALGLHPLFIFIASVIGGLTGVYVSTFLGERIKKFIARYRKPREPKPHTGLVYRIWDKFGVIGLGFIGTLTVGAPVSIGVGVGFNVPLKKLLVWCCLGVVVRCAVFTTLGHFGMKLL